MTQRTPPHRTRSAPRHASAVGVAAAVLLGAACVPPGASSEGGAAGDLQPSFAPESDGAGGDDDADDGGDDGADDGADEDGSDPGEATAGGAMAGSGDDRESDTGPDATDAGDPTGGGDAPADPGGPVPTEDRSAPQRSEITDPSGDVEPGRVAASPPDHADLVGATVERVDAGTLTLTIDLHGGAPQASRDDRHTMNIASFYDVDGDGAIDYEVWANLSSTGWGTSQFDNREGTAAYGADDDVAVEVVDGRLVLTFPTSAVGDAQRFRWALAAEWGTYEDLQLGTMSRDLAPDEQQPARFPG